MTMTIDPNAPALPGEGIYGIPSSIETASLLYIGVPWEATTSFGKGTARGPERILKASEQLDLYDSDYVDPYRAGLHLLPPASEFSLWQNKGTAAFEAEDRPLMNSVTAEVNDWVYKQAKKYLDQEKIVSVVGGDHSVPYGAIRAMAERTSFGILHLDAHADLRKAYMGFKDSHASIMYNVLTQLDSVQKLVQVGIRDYCDEEVNFIKKQGERVSVFWDSEIQRNRCEGVPWKNHVDRIIEELPDQVWISFDIDGLDPKYCPATGTPVPGGLEFFEATYLFNRVVQSGRKILGFDLVEVGDGEWDGNVGMRLLYKLSACTLASQKRIHMR